MSRIMQASRPGFTLADSIQNEINYMPSNIVIYRKSTTGDGVNAPKGGFVPLASFQALLTVHERLVKDDISVGEPYGQVAKAMYVMITRVGTDVNGNVIEYENGDIAFDGTSSYMVDSLISFTYKLEGMMDLLE